ncbi:MAG: DUF47 domain-containing protein [Thermosphaera aggregans]|jgi:uncharacterized protein Yka (UPF0111/DUF47 family)|uniref:DUF47 domain-containing protein n=1 Tax=Thermosphaera aggregans TaxID=54254 RepID=UPI003BFDA2D1
MSEVENSSLAELTAVEYLINFSRIVDEAARLIDSLVNAYVDGNDVNKLYERFREVKTKAEETNTIVMEYLVKSSEVMRYSRSYIEVVYDFEKIIQHLDGVAYRIVLLKENNVQLDKELVSTIRVMTSIVRKQRDSLELALSKLTTAPRKIISDLNEVVKLEEEADDLFRRITFQVYSKLANNLTGLMVLKDIIEYLEDVCDDFRNIGEEIRYLALVRGV